MKTMNCSTLTLVTILSLGLVASAMAADKPRDAGSKARGDAYNFWVGERAQSHARDNARSLYYYGQTQEVVPTAQAQLHVTAVRENLATCQKTVGELKKENPDNKDALASIAKIEAIHKKVLTQCDHLDKELAKETAEGAKICACCVGMHDDLDQADVEMKNLMKALKIKAPEPLPKHGHAAPAAATSKE
jgi:hypothetical protein